MSWRVPILAHFTPEIATVARLTIVSDPDWLFAEPGVLDAIRERGFDLIPFEDHVAFRYAYESRFRQVWDRGQPSRLVVVLRTRERNASAVPYDLLAHAQRNRRLLSFSLPDIFPAFAPSVVGELDRLDLDALYEAQATLQPERMGENATKDFVLRHVFGMAPELIQTPVDLLRVLLQRHYRGRVVPRCLDERIVSVLGRAGKWSNWPLSDIVSRRADFLAFLAERWPRFVRRTFAGDTEIKEPAEVYGLRFAGPVDLPFDHEDVRVYMDNLFVEGFLRPTDCIPRSLARGSWAAVGVVGENDTDAAERLRNLCERIRQHLPEEGADHTAWVATAFRWAEAVALRMRLGRAVPPDLSGTLDSLHNSIEARFAAWMLKRYASLHNVSFWPRPVMVHHIPRSLAHDFQATRKGGRSRLAVVVVDGLALDQWALLRDGVTQDVQSTIDEAAVFAWVPTLTAVSRQSIFAGDPPFYFAGSISTTQKEEQLWRRFWEDHGAERNEVSYLCQRQQEDDGQYLARVVEAAEHPVCRVLGVVLGTIDATLHGTVLGTGGLHASVRHWADVGSLRKVVGTLLRNGFEVCLTADHGNIEARGIGKPNVGAVADERGERVHIFRDDLTRERVRLEFDGTLAWPQVGIPEDYRPLLAPARGAFIQEGKQAVAHGGIALEEVIVPFVRIRTRS
jgi:hypothetical protein